MINHLEFSNTQHIYGYCACSTALADENIVASRDFRYQIAVINKASYAENSNSVIVMTYEMNLDELVAFIRDTDGQIISIEKLTNDN